MWVRNIPVFACCVVALVTGVWGLEDNLRSKREVQDTIGKTLRIAITPHAPYLTSESGISGQIYKGFLPDLIQRLSEILGFDYHMYPSPDGKWGSQNEDGTWNGMVGEVIKNKYEADGNPSGEIDAGDPGADIAASALVITSKRQKAVDFLHPFHNLGYSVMVQKPQFMENSTESSPFSFNILKPLSAGAWGVLILVTISVGSLLFAINHFDPYEWGGRYNIGQATIHQKDSFNIQGSLWFVFTSLQWQGFERAPRSVSGKILTCFWFGFVTLMLVTYIGSMVNNLWWASMAVGFNPTRQHLVVNLEDLVSYIGDDWKLGCVKDGSTHRYVMDMANRQAEFKVIKDYWENEEGQKQLVKTIDEALVKVRSEKYAFIMDSMVARWLTNKSPCDLSTIGDQFGKWSYGLAVPKNWPYASRFNEALMDMIESGEVDAMEMKWWEDRGECWNKKSSERAIKKAHSIYLNQATPKSVDLSQMYGLLVLLVIGVVLSLAALAGEILYYRYKGKYSASNSPQGQTLKLESDEGDGNI